VEDGKEFWRDVTGNTPYERGGNGGVNKTAISRKNIVGAPVNDTAGGGGGVRERHVDICKKQW